MFYRPGAAIELLSCIIQGVRVYAGKRCRGVSRSNTPLMVRNVAIVMPSREKGCTTFDFLDLSRRGFTGVLRRRQNRPSGRTPPTHKGTSAPQVGNTVVGDLTSFCQLLIHFKILSCLFCFLPDYAEHGGYELTSLCMYESILY